MINKLNILDFLTKECGNWRGGILKVNRYGYEKLHRITTNICNRGFWDD